MKSTIRVAVVALFAVAVLGWAMPAAAASNNTAATAHFLPTNGFAMSDYVYATGGVPDQKWYFASLRAGRSYAFTAIPYDSSDSSSINSVVTVYQADGTTLLGVDSQTNIQSPDMWENNPLASYMGGERKTYTSATDQVVFIKVTGGGLAGGTYLSYRVSIQETTLFCPWYFTSDNYESYVQLMNTTSTSRTAVVTFRAYNSSTVTGSQSITIAAFGAAFVAAKGAGVAVGSMGSVTITHNSHPGAIRANMTAVNGTGIGLTHSFNVPFGRQIDSETPMQQ